MECRGWICRAEPQRYAFRGRAGAEAYGDFCLTEEAEINMLAFARRVALHMKTEWDKEPARSGVIPPLPPPMQYVNSREIWFVVLLFIVLHALVRWHNEYRDGGSCVIDGVKVSTELSPPFIPIVTLPLDLIRACWRNMPSSRHYYVFTYERNGVEWKCRTPVTEDLPVASPDTVRIIDLPTERVVYFKTNYGAVWTECIRLPIGNWYDVDPAGPPLVE